MRKEKTITIDDRGNQLTFKIREMSATRLESWIIRAGLLLAGSGLLPEGEKVRDTSDALNAAGRVMAERGLTALGAIDYEKARPLLDELLGCCYHVGAGFEHQLTPEVADGIIEDVKTLFTLRQEAMGINFGFFADAGPSDTETGKPRQDSYKRKISVRSKAS